MEHDDIRNRCCCNIHVVKGANYIAIAGIALALVGIILSTISERYLNNIGLVISIFFYASVLYAQYVRNPSLYWPFLVANVSFITIYD